MADNTSTSITMDTEIITQSDPPSVFQIILIIVIGTLSFFGNLLIMRVIYNLPNARLKKTTKLLLCYVSAAFCVFSVLMSGRLCNLRCGIIVMGALNAGFNGCCGMFFLTFEAFIMVKSPHIHQRFVSINICKLGILISCLISICLDLTAYYTMKEPDEPSICYMTNGRFNPVFLIFTFLWFCAMTIATASLQFYTLRALTKVVPISSEGRDRTPTVSYINSNALAVTAPVILQPIRNARKSNLHRLITIMSVSLLCFVICWSPSSIAIIIFSACELLQIHVQNESEILNALSSLVIFNGGLHVVVYFAMSSQIRQAVNKYFRGWLCLGS